MTEQPDFGEGKVNEYLKSMDGVPNFDNCEDHHLHRKAKRQKLKGRPAVRPDPMPQQNVVKCPECGVTFDSNITIKNTKDGDQ